MENETLKVKILKSQEKYGQVVYSLEVSGGGHTLILTASLHRNKMVKIYCYIPLPAGWGKDQVTDVIVHTIATDQGNPDIACMDNSLLHETPMEAQKVEQAPKKRTGSTPAANYMPVEKKAGDERYYLVYDTGNVALDVAGTTCRGLDDKSFALLQERVKRHLLFPSINPEKTVYSIALMHHRARKNGCALVGHNMTYDIWQKIGGTERLYFNRSTEKIYYDLASQLHRAKRATLPELLQDNVERQRAAKLFVDAGRINLIETQASTLSTAEVLFLMALDDLVSAHRDGSLVYQKFQNHCENSKQFIELFSLLVPDSVDVGYVRAKKLEHYL